MTAVEWLEVQINERIVKRNPHDTIIIQTQGEVLEELFIQAKEMEKQHIIDAFEEGYGSGYRDNGKEGSEYYNETFKTKSYDNK